MPFTDDTFTHLFDWEKDPQRQEKIVNARLEAEFDGIDAGLSSLAAGTSIANGAVTNPKLADMPAYALKGRNAATTGDPGDIDISALTDKTTLAGNDLFLIQDSAASNAFKKVAGRNVRSSIIFGHGYNGSLAAGQTRYLGAGPGGLGLAQIDVWIIIPIAGVARNLYVVTDGAPGAGEFITCTLHNIFTPTALVATIPSASNVAFNGTDTVAINPAAGGARLCVQLVASAGAATRAFFSFGLEIVPA